MFNKRVIKEYKEDIIKEGAVYQIDLKGATVEHFAKTVLKLVNVQSSAKEVGVVKIRTYAGTDLIEVHSKDKESTYNVLKQLVDSYDQIKEIGHLVVLEITEEELTDVLKPFSSVKDEDTLIDVAVNVVS